MRLPRLLRTASFRLAALHALLFSAAIAALGTLTYWNTNTALQDQVKRRIEAEAAMFQQEMQWGGASQVIATITASSRGPANRTYFLLDPAGRRLAGTLQPTSDRLGWIQIDPGGDASIGRDEPPDSVRVLVSALSGGYRLGIGEDLEQLGEFEDIFLGTLLPALGIVLAIGVGGGLLLSAGLLRRIDAVSRTAEAIIAGDLSRRVERTGSNDDFDRLAGILNAMLDRINLLMSNLRQISGDIAHDLRTPLTRLRQGLEDAARRDLSAAAYKTVVERAIGEADSLLAIFSALLRIAQAEAGAMRAAFRPVDLSNLLRTVAHAYSPAIEESGRFLEIDLEDGIEIEGDRDLLTQLVANLVENALHHTPRGTTIALRLGHLHEAVVAEVADTGPGIATDERAKVLQRFYRLERSRTTPGSGLGLSLVVAVAALHQGSVELVDNTPGLRVIVRFWPSRPEPGSGIGRPSAEPH